MTDHDRGYIDGLEDWILRVEAENKKLRVKCETVHELVKSKHRLERAIESERETSRKLRESRDQLGALLKAARDELAELRKKPDPEIGILRDKVETQRRTISQIRAALERKPLPQDGAPVHPLTERALTLVNYVDQWEVVAGWVIDNLNVGRGELSSSHMITMFQAQKVEIDKLKAEIADKDRAIKACADATRLFW